MSLTIRHRVWAEGCAVADLDPRVGANSIHKHWSDGGQRSGRRRNGAEPDGLARLAPYLRHHDPRFHAISGFAHRRRRLGAAHAGAVHAAARHLAPVDRSDVARAARPARAHHTESGNNQSSLSALAQPSDSFCHCGANSDLYSNSFMLIAREVTKEYMSGEQKLAVLRDVSFTVPQGAFVAIVGPSGSGKTTLLGLLAGLDTPTRGTVLLDNADLGKLNENERARLRGDRSRSRPTRIRGRRVARRSRRSADRPSVRREGRRRRGRTCRAR